MKETEDMKTVDKTMRLIRLQRLTICVLAGSFMTTAIYNRIQQQDAHIREAITLMSIKRELFREKQYREKEREERDSELAAWRKSAGESLDAVMEDQRTIDKQDVVLEKYRGKYGDIDPMQKHKKIGSGV